MDLTALLHDSLILNNNSTFLVYVKDVNQLYSEVFNVISFIMFGNFTAETYSPNILFIEEKTDSTIHL